MAVFQGSVCGLILLKQFFSRCYALDWWACSLKGDLECAGRGQGRKWWGASAQESREGWQTRELLYLLYLVVVFVTILSFIYFPCYNAILNGGPVYNPLTPRFVQVFVVDIEEVWLMLADCSRICRRR